MSEPREFDFIPLKRAARYMVGKPRAAFTFPKTRRGGHYDNLRRQQFRVEKHDKIGRRSWQSHIESSIDTAELDDL